MTLACAAELLRPEESAALWLSLKVAGWASAIAVVPGILLGWLLARASFRGKILLDALVHLPLVVPPVVIGYLLLVSLGRRSTLGGWLDALGLELAFTWRGAAIAAGVMGLPLFVRAVRLAIELVDPRLEQAARTLGAPPHTTFLRVTLPLALPGVLTGFLLCFARALGEFGATYTFAGNTAGVTQTLPLAIYTATQRVGGDAAAMRLVILSLVLSFAALFISEVVTRRARMRLRAT